MAVLALDHVNIRTADVPATVGFFRDVLGLRAEPAPGATSIDEGCWIYDPGGRPIVHVGAADAAYPSDPAHAFTPERGGGAIHHVALECDDLAGMIAVLGAAGIDHVRNDVPQVGLTQLFVAEVNGILLELNFRG